MEVRQFAEQVLYSAEVDEKLRPVSTPFTDDQPGDAVRVALPARTEPLKFAARRSAPGMPKPGAFKDPLKRALAHHILANHELQALEVMAFVMLLFPDLPTDFRIGLAKVMQDEQRHTHMHIERAAHLGLTFGSVPVNSYIWEKVQEIENILDYLATLPLLFEERNLDHSLEFATMFEAVGDERSAALMRVIHRDEIHHVAFGIEWLRRFKPAGESDWETFCRHLKWPLRPVKAKGEVFQYEARQQAGLDEHFINQVRQAHDDV